MDLPPFALERYFAPREFTARAHLSSSDCEALALEVVLARAEPAMKTAWAEMTLGYGDVRGSAPLRTAIAGLYRDVRGDDVLCCAPSEGITLAMWALTKPGDVVVCAAPAYQSLYEVARSRGCTLRPWHAREAADGAWSFDVDELATLLPGASLVVVNLPHNPTGAHLSRAAWQRACALIEHSGAWLFSDEMYRLLEPSDDARLDSAVDVLSRAVVLSGLSKALSAPGLRSGWLVCKDAAMLARIGAFKDYTTICGSPVAELLSVMVLADRPRILADNRATVARSIAAAQAMMDAGAPLSFAAPTAGCVAFARLTRAPSAAALCDALFRRHGVLLVPSTVFDAGDRHVRFGLGRRGFALALPALAEVLAAT